LWTTSVGDGVGDGIGPMRALDWVPVTPTLLAFPVVAGAGPGAPPEPTNGA